MRYGWLMIVSRALENTVVGVVGSGAMGAGLAEVAARAGYQVVLRSRSAPAAEAARSRLAGRLERDVERGKLDAASATDILDRVRVTTCIADLAMCDLVIESVVEDLSVKKELLAELDEVVQPDAIIATNTSTLPIVDLAMATKRPDRVCGIHFFNPAPAMPLVEIARPLTASEETIAAAIRFAEACGKQPIVVEDRAGFIVNALLFPYLNNAVKMLERGTGTMEAIDAAMCGGCNFPMGPFKLLDLVGLDTSVAILDALYDEFREPSYAASPVLRRLVSAGRLGRKTGSGFYAY
jgi:3-hydroxybutyryl-CoA dehydrogenase